MKIFHILLILLLTQTVCFAYTSPYYHSGTHNKRFYKRGVMTGIPAPIYPYNQYQYSTDYGNPYYIKKTQKKYRKYYYPEPMTSITIIED